ncbi:hypothetical protein [Mycoplana ramosa]|uniref:Uncharacterized protein n=1 Tax=Mycoplana ramosa TaxID=40837 RepID=A0ABW3YWE5_MYCRA
MTIEALGRDRQVVCDACPASYPNTYGVDDFDAMIADAKAAGWLVSKRGPKWLHFCASCKPAQLRGSLL